MDLISGIKEAIKLKGSGIITAPYFISILYDLQAFAEEGINASAAPNILKAICSDTTVLKIVSGKYPRKLFGFGIKNIISNISRQYGYDKDIISDILKKLLIGTGIISDTKEWETIIPQPSKGSLNSTANNTSILPPFISNPAKSIINISKNITQSGQQPTSSQPVNKKPNQHNFRLITIAIVILCFVSAIAVCIFKTAEKQETISYNYPDTEPHQELAISYTKGKAIITIPSANEISRIFYSSDWCRAKIKNNQHIILKWSKNKTMQPRLCELKIDTEGTDKTLTVNQTYNKSKSRIKVSDITYDFYAIKDSQRGLEIKYKINSSGYNGRQFRSIVTFHSGESPLPALDSDYSFNGQCAIVNDIAMTDEAQTINAFIPYYAIQKLPKKSDYLFVNWNISDFIIKSTVYIYRLDADATIYSKDKKIRFRGISDHEMVYTSFNPTLPNMNAYTSLSLWFLIALFSIGFIIIMIFVCNS